VKQTLVGQKLIASEELNEGLAVLDKINFINTNRILVNRKHLDNIRRYFIINNESIWNYAEITPAMQQQMELMLDSALSAEPGAAYLELTKGLLHMNTENYDSAFIFFQKAIQHSPTWLMAYYYAAQALELKGNIKEAANYYEKVLLLDTAYRQFECAKCFYDALGDIYFDLKNYSKAEKYYLKALETDSAFISPITALIELYHQRKNYGQRNRYLQQLKKDAVSVTDQLYILEIELQLKLISKKVAEALLDSLENVSTAEETGLLYTVRAEWARQFSPDEGMDHLRSAYDAEPSNLLFFLPLLEELVDTGES